MAPISLSTLTNPLITSHQLTTFKSTTTSTDETTSLHFSQSLLTNSAGILLRLPQDVIATSLVLLQRYQVSSTTTILQSNTNMSPKFSPKTISAAVVYLSAKMSFTPLSPRSVVNVYAYLTSRVSPLWFVNPVRRVGVEGEGEGESEAGAGVEVDAKSYYVSEGTYERERQRIFAAETHVLAMLGFDTQVVLPHPLALTYIQALGVSSAELAGRVFEHLNGGLLSPQLLYLTHHPNALAVAAIYLAAREIGVKLVEENWWEGFDVDREDLGFLVLAYGSLSNFARAEKGKVEQHGVRISLTS